MAYPALNRWVTTRRCWCPDVGCHVQPRYLKDARGNTAHDHKGQPVEIICPSMPTHAPDGRPYRASEAVPGGKQLWASHPWHVTQEDPPAHVQHRIQETPHLRYGEKTFLPPVLR